MAKQVTQKYVIDAKQAVDAINKVAKAIDKQREKIVALNKATHSHTTATQKAIEKLGTYRNRLKDANTSLTGLNRRLPTTVGHIKDLGSASKTAANRMAAIAEHAGRIRSALRTAANAAEKFTEKFETAAKSLVSSKRAIERAITSLGAFTAQIDIATTSIRRMNRVLATQQNQFSLQQRQYKTSAAGVENMSRVWKIFSGVIFATAVHRAILRTVQALIHATKEAVEFSIRLREIRTIADRASLSVSEWSKQLRELSTTYGIEQLTAAESAYQSLSNQITDTGNTTNFLRQEIKLSIVAATELNTAVSATTAVLNSYKQGIESAARVNSLLYATVVEGRLRLEDIAETIGRVTILSSELGVSLQEVLATISLTSKRGVSAAEAMTFLRNVFLAMLKPSKELNAVFKEWGVTSAANAFATFGYAGTMEKLGKEAEKTGDRLGALTHFFRRIRGLMGGVIATSGDLKDEIGALTETAKEFTEAYDDSMEGLGRRSKIQTQKVRVFFAKMGDGILRTMVNIAESFGGADRILENLKNQIKFTIKIIVSYTVAVKAAAIANVGWGKSMLTSTALTRSMDASVKTLTASMRSLATASIAFLAVQIVFELAEAAAESRRFGDSLRTAAIEAENLEEKLAEVTAQYQTDITEAARSTNLFFAEIQRGINEATEGFVDRFKTVGEEATESLKGPFEALKKEINEAQAAIDKLTEKVKSSRESFADRRFDAGVKNVKTRIATGGGTEAQQLQQLLAFRNRLIVAANRKVLANDREGFERHADEIERITSEIQRRALSQRDREAATTARQTTIVRDPLTGIPRTDRRTGRPKTQTRTVTVGNAAEEARLLALHNQMTREALSLSTQRITVEEQLNVISETQAGAEQKRLDVQIKRTERFIELMEQINNFDPESGSGVLGGLIDEAEGITGGFGPGGGGSGLSGAEEIRVLGEARAKQIELERQERIKLQQTDLDNLRSLHQARVEHAEKVNQDAAAAQAKRLQEAQEFIDVARDRARVLDVFTRQVRVNEEGTLQRALQPPGSRSPHAIIGSESDIRATAIEQAFAASKALREAIKDMQKAVTSGDHIAIKEAYEGLNKIFAENIKLQAKLSEFTGLRNAPPNSWSLMDRGEVETGPGGLRLPAHSEGSGRTTAELLEDIRLAGVAANEVFIDTQAAINAQNQLTDQIDALGTEITQVTEVSDEFNDSVVDAVRDLDFATGAAERYTRQLEELRREQERIANGQPPLPTSGFGTGGGTNDGSRDGGGNPANLAAPNIRNFNAPRDIAGARGINVTFGDTHITAAAGTSEQQINEIANGLERRLRLGLSRRRRI